MTFSRFLRIASLGLLLAGFLAPSLARADAPTSPQAAQQFIQTLANRTIALLKNYKATGMAKAQIELKAILREGLDLDTIGHFVLGSRWQAATPHQQTEFMELFSTYVLETYARGLGAYQGENFRITGAGVTSDADALVESEIFAEDGPPVSVGWRVRDVRGHLRVIDVIVEGVSMALAQRGEFAVILQHGGMDGLNRQLRERVAKLQARGSTQ